MEKEQDVKKGNSHLEQFTGELDIIDNEMKDIDNLFGSVNAIFNVLVGDPTRVDFRAIPNISRLIESLTSLKSNKANLIRDKINVRKLAEDFELKHKAADARTGEVSGLSEIVESLKHITVTPNSVNGAGVIENDSMSEEDIDAQLLAILGEEGQPESNEEVTPEVIESNEVDETIEEIQVETSDELDLEDDLEDTFVDESESEIVEEEEENEIIVTSCDDLPDDLYLVVTKFGRVLVIDGQYQEQTGYNTDGVKIKIEKDENNELIAIDEIGDYEIEIVDV